MIFSNYRFELSFKDLSQLENKIKFCLANDINKINIPCKGLLKKEFFNETFEYLNNNYENLDVFYHYSLHHQYFKNRENSYKKFLEFIQKFNSNKNNNRILLVSGSNKKKNFDVIKVLSDFKNESNYNTNFGIAYNPYLEKYYRIYDERERFKQKIDSGLINSIWLQFGTDINLLEREINYIKRFNRDKKINIYGSLLVPSKQFISRFKFRPWKGVHISEEYLKSLDNFYFFTKDLISFYIDNEICPVIETEFSSPEKLNQLYKIINV